jgi:hypothetical protein
MVGEVVGDGQLPDFTDFRKDTDQLINIKVVQIPKTTSTY